MPFLAALPAIIPALIGAAATVGQVIYSDVNQPGAPKSPGPVAPVAQSPTTNAGQTTAAAQTLPTLQSLTGGSLSPEYASQFATLQSGQGNNPQAAGNVQAAINQFFGLGAPGQGGLSTGGVSPGGNSITQLLQGGIAGVPGSSGGTGAPGSSVTDSLLNQNFTGFAT